MFGCDDHDGPRGTSTTVELDLRRLGLDFRAPPDRGQLVVFAVAREYDHTRLGLEADPVLAAGDGNVTG